MKIRRIAYLSTLFAFLLPTLVVATVVISYTYPTSTTGVAPKVYLAQGPNYAAANAMGLFYANQVGSPANISSGTKIYFNYTYGASNEALLNVLEIVNNAPSGRTVTLTFDTLSLPTGVTMYISSSVNSKLSYSVSGGTITIKGGNLVSAGSYFILSSGTYYIGFLFSSNAQPGTGTIAFHYEIG
ncbi:MAG: hypothetical protein ACP5RL_01070 [Thermoplasmata archaeon]